MWKLSEKEGWAVRNLKLTVKGYWSLKMAEKGVVVLILGFFSRAQRPVVLFSISYAPCGPFRCFTCARQPFLFTSLRPSMCLSVSRLKGFWMRARRVPKIVKKNHRRLHDHSRKIRFIIIGGIIIIIKKVIVWA